MAVAKIETMSNSKLMVIIFFVALLQTIFFVVPAYYIPHSIQLLPALEGEKCSKNENHNPICNTGMFYQQSFDPSISAYISTESLNGFGFKLPRINTGRATDYSKWRPKMTGYLTVIMDDAIANALPTGWFVNLLARRNVNTSSNWIVYDSSYFTLPFENSHLENTTFHNPNYNGIYVENKIFLEFEPGLYDDYIVTVFNKLLDPSAMKAVKMYLQLILPNQEYLEFMVYLKVAFFVLALIAVIWFRVGRSKHLKVRDSVIQSLGAFLLFLNMPLEPLTWLNANITLLILKDIKTDIFYFALTSSCLIFIVDCIAITKQRRNEFTSSDAKPSITLMLSFLVTVIMTVFHAYQNYLELSQPLINLTTTRYRRIMGLSVTAALISYAVLYTIYLMIRVAKGIAYITIDMPDDSIASDNSYCRYDRSPFLLMSSIICVSITLVEFAVCEITRYQTKWNEAPILEYPVTLSVGVFAMWNIYFLMLLYLYAPGRDDSATRLTVDLSMIPPPSYNEYMRTVNNSAVDTESKKEKKISTPCGINE